MSMWVRNLFGDSNFFGFQGSWVECDFTQLVTAVFQGICEANRDWKCGLSAISLNLSQRYFKEFVKQTGTGNV